MPGMLQAIADESGKILQDFLSLGVGRVGGAAQPGDDRTKMIQSLPAILLRIVVL
ncbi:hypothetical protein D3C83_327980 [compost metagenome]